VTRENLTSLGLAFYARPAATGIKEFTFFAKPHIAIQFQSSPPVHPLCIDR